MCNVAGKETSRGRNRHITGHLTTANLDQTTMTELTMYTAGGGVDGHATSAGDVGHGMGTRAPTDRRALGFEFMTNSHTK